VRSESPLLNGGTSLLMMVFTMLIWQWEIILVFPCLMIFVNYFVLSFSFIETLWRGNGHYRQNM
jgi:hypothetical protein